MSELRLREFAGQHCDVVLRDKLDSTVYVTFESREGYGHPSLDREELRELLEHVETFAKMVGTDA